MQVLLVAVLDILSTAWGALNICIVAAQSRKAGVLYRVKFDAQSLAVGETGVQMIDSLSSFGEWG